MLDPETRRAAANALADAERDRVPIAPLRETWLGLDLADAYAIQLTGVAARLAAGRVVRGHKVGLTAAAMREALGIDEPDYGHLLDDMFVPDGGSVPAGRYLAPRVEVEVAFVLRAPLRGPGVTVADVLEATDHLLPSIEIIDSRIADWRIGLADTVADNASSAGVVLGSTRTPVDAVDTAGIGAVLTVGDLTETGHSSAVLGDPAAAVAWLANTLAALDGAAGLEAGHVVLPGSCTRAMPVTPGTSVRGDFDVLGSVSVTFT